jgi:hypothetical protein
MDGSNAASQPGGDANWDEAKMEQAMQRLDQLHVKVCSIRQSPKKPINSVLVNAADCGTGVGASAT